MVGVNGTILSTITVALGEDAGAPLMPSVAEFVPIVNPTAPLPNRDVKVTVRVVDPVPVTDTVAAVPAGVFNVISDAAKEILLAPV